MDILVIYEVDSKLVIYDFDDKIGNLKFSEIFVITYTKAFW